MQIYVVIDEDHQFMAATISKELAIKYVKNEYDLMYKTWDNIEVIDQPIRRDISRLIIKQKNDFETYFDVTIKKYGLIDMDMNVNL